MIKQYAKQPLVLAISLHLVLLLAFGFQVGSSKQPVDLNLLLNNQVDIIKASAVSQQQLDTRLDAINKAEQTKLNAEIQRREAIERQQAERKAKQLQQQKLEQQKLEQQKLEQQKLEQQKLAQQKQQQLAAEQQHQAQQAAQAQREKYVQTELSRYAQLILNAIAAQWMIDTEYVDRDLSTNFLLKLDKAGNVKEVTLQKSSGYNRLDNAARDAIYAASPLPMSSEADVYTQLASISLTMRPEQVLSPNRLKR